MSALALPKKLSVNHANRALCARIGVRVNGKDMGEQIVSYDLEKCVATTRDGKTLSGRIEPYWR